MNLKDLLNNIKQTRQDLVSTRVQDLFSVATDSIALIKIRWQQGLNYQENVFSDYSTLYAKRRERRGRQADKKTFSDTGQLARSLKPNVVVDNDGSTSIEITADNEDDKLKLQGQLKRDGNILRLSQREVKLLRDTYTKRRLKRIRI